MSTIDRVSELVAVAEVALMLDLSEQRAYQLDEDVTFPKPTEQLTVGRIWNHADVDGWSPAPGRC